MPGKMERRSFLKYFSLGVIGSAFSNFWSVRKRSVEYLMPYVVPPAGVIPGIANWYSSVCRLCPSGCGIHVKIREGRAKKIEGNPEFPVNHGRLCARGQAGLQALYDPDRITGPKIKTERGFEDISWKEALEKLSARLSEPRVAERKDSVAFLTDPLRGNLAALISKFFGGLGAGDIYSHQLYADEGLKAANKQSFGQAELPDYDIANTHFILSLGTEFMDTWASPVKHAVGYGRMRDKESGSHGERGWLVQFEPRLSVTGASADEWHPIKPETQGLLALGIANVIVNKHLYDKSVESEIKDWKKTLAPYSVNKVSHETGVKKETITKVAKSFALANPAIAICGGSATAQVNGGFNAIAANILNHLVGNVGHKGGVRFPAQSFFNDQIEKSTTYSELRDLSRRMSERQVEVLFINNTNPVFTLPRRVDFAESMQEVALVVSLSNVMDETTALADLILPDLNYLEGWGDYVPLVDSGNKTVGLMQPVVAPVNDSKAVGDVFLELAKLIGGNVASVLPEHSFENYLKKAWKGLYEDGRSRGKISEDTFDKFWDVSLEKGGWWEEESAHVEPAKRPGPGALDKIKHTKSDGDARLDFHLELYPSHTAYDGRGANLPWMQQLPAPLVTVTWGSWAEINPKTAKKLDIVEGDVIEIVSGAGKIRVPAFIYPAIGPETIAVPIGQGHTSYGRFAKGYGVNPLTLVNKVDNLSGGLAWASTKVSISKTDEYEEIVKTDPKSDQPGMENGPVEMGRHLVQWMPPEEAEELADHGEELEPVMAMPSRDLRKPPHFLSSIGLAKYRSSKYYDYEYRWGMVVDLDKCNGCGTCTIACAAENNIVLTDASELSRGRAMNWIRVDRYWEGDYPKIRAKMIPVNCYQCGNAPCEPVCPVYAAYHTVDGLNGQVYPRCIGTRYCNAGCPYKARLFNWQRPQWVEPLNHQLNTDVSVRFAGVTEKCTFCVQRIRAAKDIAKDENRRVRDGEIQPACVQTCPTGAMYFGDLNDPNTQVSELTKNPRRYRMLEELNTEPAVIYLKALRKGAIEEGTAAEEHGGDESGSADEH